MAKRRESVSPEPRATEPSPLEAGRLAPRRTTAAGEIEVRRCPRTSEPTWQIPRRGGFSPVEALRRVFGVRR